MVSLKTLNCPRCGATVELDSAGERATCQFCRTVSYTERVGRPGAPIVVVKSHPIVLLSLSLGLLALLIAAGSLLASSASAPTAAPAQATGRQGGMPRASAPPEAPAAETPLPEPETQRTVASYAPARLVDADGDGDDELLVPIERQQGSARSAHFAVYTLPALKLLEETPALEQPQRALTAVVRSRLLSSKPNGELEAYDLASGDRQWTTALGERVAALCAASERRADALHVVTDDGRNLLVDVMTGRQSPVRDPCPYPLAVASGRHAPSDRRDYRAPRALRAFLCGGVRVMGSQNYAVADACKTQLKIDSDRLEGMVGHAIWSVGKAALVFGVRKPGTYIPMVGLLERGRWLWKSEVPHENPLEAEQGGPRVVSLHGDGLVIAYASERRDRRWVTRFRLADGIRSFTTELPAASDQPVAIVQNEQAVVVHGGRALHVLSPADGAVIATLAGR